MCGIAGVFSTNHTLLSQIGVMVSSQSHRGPDGAGHLLLGRNARWREDHAPQVMEGDFLALGHRRLAILDCSPAGAQPMASHDRRDWISYNGEIYNYIELREELKRIGFQFSTETDTEVVLSAYRAWGLGCFSRFNGMWALALWDGERKKLILSRDRLGVKPLYFFLDSYSLLFSSEIKGVLASGHVESKLNLSVAIDFLKWSTVNHNNESFFKGIKSFPAGHYAVVDGADVFSIRPEPFWRLTDIEESKPQGLDGAARQFRDLFQDAVRLRLRSDVPVGSCLSGGLDSSAIVCQADALRVNEGAPFHTFTSGDSDPRFDECYWSDLVASKVGTVAHKVFPSAQGFSEDLQGLLWHQEEPFPTASIYAQWCIMRQARQKEIPVLLDGQGADEILCGYRKFYLFYLRELFREKSFRQIASELEGLVLNGDRGYLRWREGFRYLPGWLQKKLPNLADTLTETGRQAWSLSQVTLRSGNTLRKRQIDDLLHFSVPSLLRYEDRNSMAWSIESRVPFLDYRLVEAMLAMPASVKLHKGRTKALMRQGLEGLVPQEILYRRDKMGFVTAQERWIKVDLRTLFEDQFSSPKFRLGFLVDQKRLISSFSDFLEGRQSMSHNDYFRIFILDAWMARFVVNS